MSALAEAELTWEDARAGRPPEGWLYLPEGDSLRLDTPRVLVIDDDLARDERGVPTVAVERGFETAGLNDQMMSV